MSSVRSFRTCKRKFSDESDGSVPFYTKMARLDTQADSWKYCSALTLANVTQLYDALTLCFKYLTVRDLLRVSMSCKYLNRIASESSLVSIRSCVFKLSLLYNFVTGNFIELCFILK